MSKWNTLSVNDCMDAIIDYRGKTPTKTTHGIPLVTAKIIKAGRMEDPSEFIAIDAFDAWMTRGLPLPGDVVLTTEAPLGEVAQLDERKVALAQRVITLRGKSGLLDNTYLKYALQGDYVRSQLLGRASGSTVSGIKQSELRKVEIPIPPFSQQQNIARILGSLDDKIALNREMNKTLEAMAQAIFKSWFVDFESFKEGEFVESELGMIPKGWEVSSIGAETTSVGGATPSTTNPEFWEDGEFYWATPKDLSGLQEKVLIGTERKITNAGVNKISSGQLPVGTVLLSSRAPIGYLAITTMPVSINQGFIAMVCNKRLPHTYVLQWATYKLDDIKQRGSGTTFAEISKSTFRPIQVLVPDKESLQKYDEVVRSYYNQIAINIREAQTLSTLRDTLLPKLLSGEIEV